jgi:hypothetical protein
LGFIANWSIFDFSDIVRVNGQPLNPDDYIAAGGSEYTYITLHNRYLETLAEGEYGLEVVFNGNESVWGTFHVGTEVPPTPGTYRITARAGAGGTVSPALIDADEGSEHTITITPNSGYEIKDVMVDNESVGKVSSFTFSDISRWHTLEATFVLKAADAPTTPDTPATGDNTNLAGCIVLLIASVAVLAGLLIYRFRKAHKQ